MKRIKQSLCWWCYVRGEMTPEHLLRAAAEIGYEAVELVDEAYWPLVRQYGLSISAIGGHGTLSEGLNRREHHDRIEKEILENLVRAEKWQIPNLIVFSGNRDGLDDRTGAEVTAEGLRRVSAAAENAGVTLVLELLNSKVDHPDYQCDKAAWGLEVCRMVNSPRVKLLYDIYHMQIMEGDIIRTIRGNHRFFGHYHTAGNPGRHEIDASQEINYAPIMRTLLETGYDGFVGQEFVPTRDTITAIKEAFDICNVTVE
jgi:hydroxypyruvate isomerase